ncbi:reticulate body protein Rbp-7 [Chlamydia gallinacea]|uniref:Uncharacterized protein n=2 Tax=Chlamydia gallinacea TaxID=1457153 RepID=A0A173DY74_9CHLA|nr:reticulate body protein Rbp-7 [Chlamydia gallinacea]EYE60803.1 hypothetical protein M127_5657 [Bacteroides fragilis str. S6L5]ANG65884.1 hypothetical protein M787_000890 [Chlamydia gallinacea 08-1274/3]AQT77879.1 hypothetical protein B1F83_04745 [Chlamydia gallinacea]MBX6680534.1 reticulate body protein Rbp-7 [Chlamydia gallinacea]MBX6687439.1 reticulate body protein Rbp-7 [Chlamydia gallinacea]
MPHTITLPKEHDTEKVQEKLQKITLASSEVLKSKCEAKNKKPYEVFQAESTLSVEANKIASIAEYTLFSCSYK